MVLLVSHQACAIDEHNTPLTKTGRRKKEYQEHNIAEMH